MKRILSLLALCTLLSTRINAAPEEFSSSTISIGVVVSDLNKSLAFYTNVIGMVQTGSFDIKEDMSRKTGLTDGVPTQVKILKLGNSPDATQWKLMSFGDKAKSGKEQHIHTRTGMRYITIMVKDLTPILKRINENKVKLLGETPLALGGDNYFVLVQDPDGTFVELIGPKK